MEPMTYEQVLASIDREKAARAVARSVIYLGGLQDWGSDEFMAVQEQLTLAIEGSGLPPFGDQTDETWKFWGELSLAAGNDTDYEPAQYVATISVPGYLPMDDEPPVFDTPREAWQYLRDERERGLEQAEDYDDDETLMTLDSLAKGDSKNGDQPGSVVGDTPGYQGEHDLGLIYAVREHEEDGR